jgi:hypothetical protein
MSGVLKLEIAESVETLKELLTQQKRGKWQQRVRRTLLVKNSAGRNGRAFSDAGRTA